MANRLLIATLLASIVPASVSASSVVYETVNKGWIYAHVVTVDLTDSRTRVTVALAHGGVGKSESFKSIVKRTRPTAAITGTFFDTRTLIPTGDIGVFGRIVHTGCIGSALCIDSRNKAAVVPMAVGRKNGWVGYETVLCCGPALVSNGSLAVSVQHEGFGGSLYAPATRTAVGITRAGKLLLVAVNRKTTLHRVAKLMIALGARQALSLDGGSSTGFYANSGYWANPVRRLTNLLVVYSKSSDYANARVALVPASLLPKTATAPKESMLTAFTAAVAVPVSDTAIPRPAESRR
jgi:hypothetical protein